MKTPARPAFHYSGYLICHGDMGKSILITGGARSGKSRIAESLTLQMGPSPVYIATALAGDDEMAARIAQHQLRRGEAWRTINETHDIVSALRATDGGGARLVDCLTLWLSNLMHEGTDWRVRATALADCLAEQSSPVVLVTNEVGAGIVPENALAREFRDAAGAVNQTVAHAVDEVYFAVSGYPLKVKPNAEF